MQDQTKAKKILPSHISMIFYAVSQTVCIKRIFSNAKIGTDHNRGTERQVPYTHCKPFGSTVPV